MSKADGKKIGIKFTLPITGDISGNESAFSVTGQEYQYINGPLLNKSYTVESVERAPAGLFYQETFNGVSDGVEVNGSGLILTLPIPEFSPTDITGLQLWLDASQITGLSDGNKIATWNDLSVNANNFVQGTTLNQPTFKTSAINGLPVARFDGVDSFMQSINNHALSFSGAISVFYVAYKNATAYKTYETILSVGTVGAGGSNAEKSMGFGFSNDTQVSPRPAIVTDIWRPSGMQVDESIGANTLNAIGYVISNWSTHRTSGTNVYKNGIGKTIKSYGTNNPTSLNASKFKIGCFDVKAVLPTSFFAGDIAEVIVYNTALSTTDRQAVETYLMTKYGIGGA